MEGDGEDSLENQDELRKYRLVEEGSKRLPFEVRRGGGMAAEAVDMVRVRSVGTEDVDAPMDEEWACEKDGMD